MLLYAVKDPGSHMIPKSQKQVVSKNLHDAVSFSRLSSFCKLIVPVGLPSLSRSKLYDICGMYCFSFRCLSTLPQYFVVAFHVPFLYPFLLAIFYNNNMSFLGIQSTPPPPSRHPQTQPFFPLYYKVQTNLLFIFL